MMQYVPKDGLYVYFRYDSSQTVMCVMNTDSLPESVDFSQYTERTGGFNRAVDVLSEQTYDLSKKMDIPAMHMQVLELKK